MIPLIITIACAVYLGTRDWKVVLIPAVLWGIWQVIALATVTHEATFRSFMVTLCCLTLVGIFGGFMAAISGTFRVLCGLAVVAILFW